MYIDFLSKQFIPLVQNWVEVQRLAKKPKLCLKINTPSKAFFRLYFSLINFLIGSKRLEIKPSKLDKKYQICF